VMFSQCLDGEIKKIKAAAIISKSSGIDGMIKGQIIDIRSEGQSIDEVALLDMHKNKTGQLITASIMAGAIVGEASEKDIEILKSFGEKLGLAFQIKDDILDVEGDFKLLGKTQSDGENNKTNFITMYGIHKCKEFCNNLTQECYNLLSNIERDTKEIEDITKFLLEREY